jgi:hypothetical protein
VLVLSATTGAPLAVLGTGLLNQAGIDGARHPDSTP